MSQLSDDESSDSSNDFLVPADKIDLNSPFFKQPAKKPNPPKRTRIVQPEESSDSNEEFDDVNDDDVSSAELLAQVLKNLENTKNQVIVAKSTTSEPTTSKALEQPSLDTVKTENDLSLEISDLLRQGESAAVLSKQDEEYQEIKPEVKPEYAIPEKGVEIHMPGENFMFDRKKKKKQQDLRRMLQNKINQRIRSSQVLVHKVGLLFWLSHGFCMNKIVNDPDLLAVTLSLISANNYPKDRTDLKYLEKFTKWFSGMFTVVEEHKDVVYHKDLLVKRIETKKIHNYIELVLLYIATLRGMGINSRLVIALKPPPLKPRPEQLFKIPNDEDENKNSPTKNSNAKKSATKARGAKGKAGKQQSKSEEKSVSPSKIIPENSSEGMKNAILEAKKKAAAIFKGKLGTSESNGSKKIQNKSSRRSRTTKNNSMKENSENEKDENDEEVNDSNMTIARKLRSKIQNNIKSGKDNKSVSQKNKKGTNTKSKRTSSKRKHSSSEDYSEESQEESSDEMEEINSDEMEEESDYSTDEEYVDKKPKKRPAKKDNQSQNVKNRSISSKIGKKTNKSQKVLSSDEDDKKSIKNSYNVWAEVYVESEESWISINVLDQKIHCISEIYKKAGNPVLYVVAWNSAGTLKDVTRRYCPHWLTDTRKKRVDEKWWSTTLETWKEKKTAISKAEDKQLLQRELEQPLPKTVSECKGHPLYVLQRHLLKFEALYPPDVVPLGHLKTGEAIYSRHCVHTLYSRETWVKRARVVKPAQEAYKTVKAMPKYDKLSGMKIKDQPLELFGKWQTNPYVPPEAKDGKVPRNEYGNVDLFKMCMLPKGTVYINLPALSRIARKLNIDCAPACVGFNFGCRGALPAFEGFVVCSEYEDTLREAWEEEQIEATKRAKEKREKRIYGNWKKLIKGLIIRERLAVKYNFRDEEEEENYAEEERKKEATAKKGKTSKAKVTSKKIPKIEEKRELPRRERRSAKHNFADEEEEDNAEEEPKKETAKKGKNGKAEVITKNSSEVEEKRELPRRERRSAKYNFADEEGEEEEEEEEEEPKKETAKKGKNGKAEVTTKKTSKVEEKRELPRRERRSAKYNFADEEEEEEEEEEDNVEEEPKKETTAKRGKIGKTEVTTKKRPEIEEKRVTRASKRGKQEPGNPKKKVKR